MADESGPQGVWIVMWEDYEDAQPVAAFRSEDEAERYCDARRGEGVGRSGYVPRFVEYEEALPEDAFQPLFIVGYDRVFGEDESARYRRSEPPARILKTKAAGRRASGATEWFDSDSPAPAWAFSLRSYEAAEAALASRQRGHARAGG